MKPYTTYTPITGRVTVGVPVALPERGLVVVVEATWGDTGGDGQRVRLDPTPAYREQRAAACALAAGEMARLAARAMRRDDERLACAAALVALDWCYLYRRYGDHRLNRLNRRGG